MIALQGSGLEELALPTPAGPAATPVCVKQELHIAHITPAASLETLEPTPLGAATVGSRI